MHQYIMSSGENHKKGQKVTGVQSHGRKRWSRPSNPLLPFLVGRDGEKGRQLLWEAVPGQTGNQRAAFWDCADKVQTQCGGQDLVFPPPPPTSAQFPHLPTLTHLLTVWTVSFRSTSFFCPSPFILPFFLHLSPLSLTTRHAISIRVFMAPFLFLYAYIHSSAV